MHLWKNVAIVALLVLGFVGAGLAGTNPDWRSFKLGLGPFVPQSASSDSRAFPRVEITILGGFMSGFGLLTAEDVASNLFTGMSSPWYGAGHTGFYWSPTGPAKLDGDIEGPMLKKESGALAGIKLGFNVSRSFQVEFFFNYGFSGYAIDDASWANFAASKSKSISAIQAVPRTVTFDDMSLQKAGKAILGGVNLKVGFPVQGPIMPYVTVGAGMMSISDTPLISWSMKQSDLFGSATYTMDITYASKMAILLDAGFGIKFYLGPNYGLELEGRGNMAMVSLDKNLVTGFQSVGGGWIPYTPYDRIALTEKGSPIFATGTLGFFYGF